jgi:hypothetical protein
VPIDPDEYSITAEAPRHERWQHTISVSKTSKTIEVPQLDVVVAPIPPLPAVAVPIPPHRDREAPSSWTTGRKAAAGLGVLGVALAGTGIAFGLHANNLESQSDAICPTARCNDRTAIDLNRRARTDGLIANIGMIGGSAMLAGAVALWIVWDTKPHKGVSIVPSVGPSGIALGGTY